MLPSELLVRLPRPPDPPPPATDRAGDLAAPLAGAAAFALVAGATSSMGWLFGAGAVAATLGARGAEFLATGHRHRRDRLAHVEHLSRIDRRIDEAAKAWIADLAEAHPAADHLLPERIWERAPGDPDFLVARIGTGPVPVPIRVVRPQSGRSGASDRRLERIGDLVARERSHPGPVLLDLGRDRNVAVIGPRDEAVRAVLALCLDLAWFHHPDDLRLLLPPTPEFDSLRLLPHAEELPTRAGTVSVASPDATAVVRLVPDPVPPETTVVLDVAGGQIRFPAGDRAPGRWRPDPMPDGPLRTLARCLPADADGPQPLSTLLRAVRLPAAVAAIGHERSGAPVVVDLREASEGGAGPHLLVVGATGTGKSELLRTLAVALVDGRTPSALQLLLVDFKGGSAFAPLARLPHTAGIVSDLERDEHAARRLREVLDSELSRRKEHLADGGGRVGNGMPRLVVIVDEFAELLARHPDVSHALESIGRTGRSLGVHLVLAGQRPDPSLLRRLEGHLRLRICLRTFTADDSLDAIGVPDAVRLPTRPGHALLSDGGRLRPFRVAPADRDPAAMVRLPDDARTEPARKLLPTPLPRVVTAGPAGVYAVTDETGGGAIRRLDPGRSPSILVSGGPGSGKTGALRALVVAAGTRHEPTDCILVGDDGLTDLLPLAHVADVVGITDRDRVSDTLASVAGRAVRRTIVGIDGLEHLLADEELRRLLRTLVDDGPGRRVHLAATVSRPAVAGGLSFAERVELHLPEPGDRRHTGPGRPAVPRGLPGRGADASGSLVQFLHVPAPVPMATAARIALTRLGAGPAPTPERLPDLVHLAGLPADGSVGITLPGLRPWRPPGTGDLVVIGGPGSGRTTLVRAVLAAVTRTGGAPVDVVDDADRLDPDRLAQVDRRVRSPRRAGVVLTAGPSPLHEPPVRHLVDAGAPVLLLDAPAGSPTVRGVGHRRFPPGRGLLVDRAGAVTPLQVAMP